MLHHGIQATLEQKYLQPGSDVPVFSWHIFIVVLERSVIGVVTITVRGQGTVVTLIQWIHNRETILS